MCIRGYGILKIRLRISIFGILLLLILLFGDNSEYTVIALTAAAVHELGHIIAARLLGLKFGSLSVGLFGARLGLTATPCSYRKELLLCAFGPLFNIVSGGAALYIFYAYGRRGDMIYVLFFAVASFFLAALNLLPIKSFDGGRMFICMLAPPFGIYAAERVLGFLSFIFVLLLWAVSMYLMLRVGSSLALFVFSSALFAELFLDPEIFPS